MTTDTRPSIAELEAAEGDLPPDWRYDAQGWIETMCRTCNHTGSETEVLVLGARNERREGEAIVEIRNAAPALIAIVKAAQAVIDAHDRPDLIGDAWHIACADARAWLRMELGKVRP